ncbi:MAG: DUF502 domain-containing protein [Candidatus Omnitrophica bacterium]|nr:DUF502 domain-containing protein [Candidatus Omnitrophota bacterium]MBU4473378.1 DUF502 domain-containing protein [Candidatus Omnitrophota bacterium]MCG2706981.1 DUF502 domain-containing protein [Candidatus Omnitrophota bacterium]
MERLRRYLIAGLAVIVPISLSIFVLVIVFRFIDGILGRFLNVYIKQMLGFYIPGLGFLISVFLILLIGFFATRFIGKKIFLVLEKWFSGLPLIKTIYPTFKQIILFILAKKELGFKKVVLVEYPSRGIWSIGFLTNEQFEQINKVSDKEMVSVFVASSPGPLTGYVIFVPKEEIKLLDISIQDALKIIISGGVFRP